jgi:hypothetical protein
VNTTPCTPRADAVACDAIPTRTWDTAVPVYAVVTGFPPVFSVAVPSGGPTHTGVSPARADPADGPAVSGTTLARTPTEPITAVPVTAAGHDTGAP